MNGNSTTTTSRTVSDIFWGLYNDAGVAPAIMVLSHFRYFIGGPGSNVAFVLSGVIGACCPTWLDIQVTHDMAIVYRGWAFGFLMLSWVVCTATYWKAYGFRAYFTVVNCYLLILLGSVLSGYAAAL